MGWVGWGGGAKVKETSGVHIRRVILRLLSSGYKGGWGQVCFDPPLLCTRLKRRTYKRISAGLAVQTSLFADDWVASMRWAESSSSGSTADASFLAFAAQAHARIVQTGIHL